MATKLAISAVLIATVGTLGCSSQPIQTPQLLSVCEAVARGNQLVGKHIVVDGWIQVTRHYVLLGDRDCPSENRGQFLTARGKSNIPISLADPNDRQSQMVKDQFGQYPTWPEWSFRGKFQGTMMPRRDEVPSALPNAALSPYELVVDRIDEFRVERPPFLPARSPDPPPTED